MLQTLRDSLKVEELRKKLIFTFLMLLLFRLGNSIPVPFVNTDILAGIFEQSQGNGLAFLNLLSGGALGQFSIFALSIYPYITSSIIIQLLTVAIPQLEELSKEGEEGRRKIQYLTKIGAVLLAAVQAFGTTNTLFASAIAANGALERISIILVLVAGTMFLVWLSDLITEKGIGNGTSMLIFVGIVSRLPSAILSWGQGTIAGLIHPVKTILMLVIVILVIAGVVLINKGERRINVQYAKRVVGRKMYGGQSTHIPVKVNMGGVMPVIFASSLLSLPSIIGFFIGGSFQDFVTKYFSGQMMPGILINNIMSVILIIVFAFFYTMMQFNTVEYSKNLQQQGGFIPGIRPGRPTSDYLSKVAMRVTVIGAFSLAVLHVLPTVLSAIFKLNISFGGTAIIIVVGVILDTFQELESMMLIRNYKGFLSK